MNTYNRTLFAMGLALILALIGCKSEYEKETAEMAKTAIDNEEWDKKLKALRKNLPKLPKKSQFEVGVRKAPMTKQQLIDTFGPPFKVEKDGDGRDQMVYALVIPSVHKDCIATAMFTLSDGTEKRSHDLLLLPKDTVWLSHGYTKPSRLEKCR